MSATAAADPVRAHVEETLRQIVDSVAGAPCRVARRARDRLTTTFGLVQSMAELAFGAVLGRGAATTITRSPDIRPPSALPVQTEPATGPSGDAPSSDSLPLEGYESLAASHVVARLARLTPSELEEIREFELANRGRRTILGKIEQLLNS